MASRESSGRIPFHKAPEEGEPDIDSEDAKRTETPLLTRLVLQHKGSVEAAIRFLAADLAEDTTLSESDREQKLAQFIAEHRAYGAENS